MGMFDTVRFKCPKCAETVEYQSKCGPCELNDYSLDNAPLMVIADLNDEGREGRLCCEHCSEPLKAPVRFTVDITHEGGGGRRITGVLPSSLQIKTPSISRAFVQSVNC